MSGDHLTVTHVAEQMHVKPRQVLLWINSQQLAAVNVATSPKAKRPTWRITPEDLQEFLRKRRREPAKPVQPKAFRHAMRRDFVEYF